MSFFGLVIRNLVQRRLSAVLTALSVALGVMLVIAILIVKDELEATFERPSKGYSLVVGPPKGSELALVLNSIYHVEQSAGLLPWSVYESVRDDPGTRLALPYAVGDNFRGHRVIATTDKVFDKLFPHPAGTVEEKFAAGRPFRYEHEDLMRAFEVLPGQSGKWMPEGTGPPPGSHIHPLAEAVIGWGVYEKHGVKVNNFIEATHGVEGEGTAHSCVHEWEVVGILKETGTPVDDVIFINLDSFYAIEDHKEGAIMPSKGEPGISAVVTWPKPGVHKALLMTRLKVREDLMVAEVASEVRRLLGIVGRVDQVYFWTAVLVVLIGVVSVMVAIYNTMSERRREIAILRALGAGRRKVLGVIVTEATLLAFLGSLVGLLLGHLLLLGIADTLQEAAKLRIDAGQFLFEEPLVILAVTLFGALAGLVPAWKAYRTDVASNLAPIA